MLAGTAWTLVFSPCVSCACLPLELLCTKDLVDMVQVIFGRGPMGVMRRGGVTTACRLGGACGGTSLAAGGPESCDASRLVESAVRKARGRV